MPANHRVKIFESEIIYLCDGPTSRSVAKLLNACHVISDKNLNIYNLSNFLIPFDSILFV